MGKVIVAEGSDSVRSRLNALEAALGAGGTHRLDALESQTTGWVNVASYGATGNGVSDDTSALTSANAASAPKRVPAGTYAITSGNVTLDGVWIFEAGAVLRPSPGRTVITSATARIYAAAPWLDLSAGGSKTYTAGASKQSIAIGKASHTANIVNGFVGNGIAADVGTSVITGGGNAGSENLIGFTEYLDILTGDGVTTQWTTTFDATPAQILVSLVRADGVRVNTLASDCDLVQSGSQVQVTYPRVGHFVNDAAGGAEGTNAALLATQKLYVSSNVKPEATGSGCDYSAIYGGYDCIIQSGIRNTVEGAHHRITQGTHKTIFGGSYNRDSGAGDYNGIFAGSANTITAGGSASFVTGFGNTVSGTGPGVAIGSAQNVSGAFAAAVGGTGNAVSGNGSTATGRSNTVSGQDGFAAGNTNTVSAPYSAAAGFTNTVSGTGYAAAVGRQNTASGGYSFACGRDNTVSADHSTATGKSAKAALSFAHTIGGEQFAALGDAQSSVVVARRQTTNATPTELRLGAATARLTIPTDTTWAFSIIVVARRTDADNESAAYKIEGCLDNNAGTVALVGTAPTTVLAEDTAAWDVTATADNTNKALSLTVTGEAAKTINWVARVTLVEVTG